MKPLLRWAGGKSRLINQIVSQLPERFNWLIEPFAGSAALTFHLENQRACINDLNPNLINFYWSVLKKPEEVWKSFSEIRVSEFDYYEARAWWNKTKDPGCFLYINVYGHHGLWRTNGWGECNVPYGHGRHGRVPTQFDIDAACNTLSDVGMSSRNWLDVSAPQKTDLWYVDPPYPNTFNYGFELDQAQFLEDLRWLGKSTRVLLSYPDVPEVYAALTSWIITPVSTRQTIQAGRTRRRQEVLARNYRIPSDILR